MPLNQALVGKAYPAVSYEVGREKLREFAIAVGETDPLYHDEAAARAAGHPDIPAVPTFAVRMAAARFRFDAMADRWARRDTRSPSELLDALRATADRRFRVPGAPA